MSAAPRTGSSALRQLVDSARGAVPSHAVQPVISPRFARRGAGMPPLRTEAGDGDEHDSPTAARLPRARLDADRTDGSGVRSDRASPDASLGTASAVTSPRSDRAGRITTPDGAGSAASVEGTSASVGAAPDEERRAARARVGLSSTQLGIAADSSTGRDRRATSNLAAKISPTPTARSPDRSRLESLSDASLTRAQDPRRGALSGLLEPAASRARDQANARPISVHIGRIEIVAAPRSVDDRAERSRVRARPAPAGPQLTLAAYLARREGTP